MEVIDSFKLIKTPLPMNKTQIPNAGFLKQRHARLACAFRRGTNFNELLELRHHSLHRSAKRYDIGVRIEYSSSDMQDSTDFSGDQPRFGAGRFPNPSVMNAGISSTDVENEDGSYEVKNVLWSSSGSYYEFSIVIKKSIYGLVVRANVLEQISPDAFRRTGRDVAIKVCAKDVLMRNGGVSLENPITEIGAMQDVGEPRHPNIATQFECCVDEKNIYSVLKFHHGVELFDHILNNGPLNEVTARCMFQQLMLSLFRLQCRDIAHRDISLENIMYNPEDHGTVLIDFGLCVKLQRDSFKRGEYLLVPNAACGKSYYMPPESAWDGCLQLVNPMEGDIWSAGMCLLYALLGFPPIERACEDDVRYKYLTQGRLPELLEHWEVRLSPELVDLIQMVLRPEPSDRPTVQQILQHSWMQQDGLPYPFLRDISAEELSAACGHGHGHEHGTASTSTTTSLSPLLHPHVVWETMDTDMDAQGTHLASDSNDVVMSINTDDCTTREEGELSFRSSVESRWSCGTTPTAAHSTAAAGAGMGLSASAAQLAAALSLTSRSGSFSSTTTTHLPYNISTTNLHVPTEGSLYNHGTQHIINGISVDTQQQVHSPSALSSGVNSGAATPSTHSFQAGTHQQSVGVSTGGASVTAQQQYNHNHHQNHNHNLHHNHNQTTHHSFDLRINTGASRADHSNSEDYCETNLNMTNASTVVTNSTNTTAPKKAATSNFTGYHTRSHSFGKANINYAV